MFQPTKKQKQALAAIRKAIKSDKRLLLLLYGGIRAGKSTAGADGMVEHTAKHPGETYGLGAYTLRQAFEIFEPKFYDVCKARGITFSVSRSSSDPHFIVGDCRFMLAGGNDVGRDRNIQGLTWAGLLLDELPLLNRDFVMQCEARTSGPGALRIYTANKPNPYHWSTKHYYNRAKKGEIDAVLMDWDITDNPHIGQDFIEERMAEYDDKYRNRFINNEFVLDNPPLYEPLFDDTEPTGENVTVLYGNGPGFDMIQASATDYGLCANTSISVGIKELDELIPDFGRVFVNSERPVLAKKIRAAGKPVRGYDAMFQPRRVEYTQVAIADGRLRLSPNVDGLIEEIAMYSTGGLYRNGYVRGFEIMGEYVCRTLTPGA